MFHEYEITIIIRPDIDDATTKAAIEKIESVITDLGSHILERDDWGKRKLAYHIGDHTKGHYVLWHAVAQPEHILEIERRMRLADAIIRFLTVKTVDEADVTFLLEQREERRKAAEAAAAAEAAEAEEADADTDAAAEA